MKLITIAAAAIAVSAAPAFAQDNDAFVGPWVGVGAGYDRLGTDTGDDDGSKDGVNFGIAAGYDFNLGGLISGVEAELTDSSISASEADVFEDGDELRIAAGRDLYAGIRVGIPVSDAVMIYGKAGYTNQRFKVAYSLDDETLSESENIDGYRLGAGAELNLGDPFARVEYRYSDYGSFSDTDLETSRHQLMLTAGFRF